MNNKMIILKLSEYEIEKMLEAYLKEKFGDQFEPVYLELCAEKVTNKHIINGDDNTFSLYVEFNNGGKK